jgi:hypothetical protein
MTNTLEVLVIESHRGAAAAAVHDLEAAGHHVRRCYDEDRHGFPCRGVVDVAQCPLARHADVALLVRGRVAPHPTALEQGATCAIRAGIPLVEAGPAALDPFEHWLAARVDHDVVATCEAAAGRAGARRGAGVQSHLRTDPDLGQRRGVTARGVAEGRVDRGSGQPSPISGRSMCSCSSITRIVSGVTAAISAASTSRIDSTPTARPARATTKWRTP